MYPALATIEGLRNRVEADFLYVGGYRGIEKQIIPRYGIPLRTLWISGFQRNWTWRNLLFPVKLLVSLVQSWYLLRQFSPHVAIGTGGYVSGPVLWVAARRGIPVLIQEQDLFPGITTRLLARWAKRICLAFEGARQYLKSFEEKIVVTGNPVRQNLRAYRSEDARRLLGLKESFPTVLIFGGSQGARSLNQAILRLLQEWNENIPLQIIWQTGQAHFAAIQKQLNSHFPEVKLFSYLEDMALAYAACDVVVCRAGAITLAELAVVQKPAILVPYPYAAAGHQLHNAEYIANKGAAVVVTEKANWEKELLKQLQRLLQDEAKRQQMARAWKQLQVPDATNRVVEEVLKLLRVEEEKSA